MFKKTTVIQYLLLSCFTAPVLAQDFTGQWQGLLNVGEAKLPIVIHINASAKGKYSGTLDSPMQVGFDLPMSDIEVKGNQLIFEASSIGIYYEGRLNASNDLIEGTFIQGSPLDLDFSRLTYSESDEPNDIAGTWTGDIYLPGTTLPYVIHIKSTASGLVSQVDSPQEKAYGLPVDVVSFDNGKFNLEMKKYGIQYSGRLLEDKQHINGFFEQKGGRFALNVSKNNQEQ